MALKSKRYAALFLAPSIILITVFMYYPIFQTFYSSFTEWIYFSIHKKFIGFDNYKDLIADPVIHKALINTFIMMGFSLLFEIGIALVLALMVDSIRKGKKFFRVSFFFPVVISATAIALMFSLAYQYDYGLFNNILHVFGKDKILWLTEKSSMILVTLPTVWQYVGFYFVIFLTSMSKVPTEIYESAILEGITGIKKAFYITIPLIWESIAVAIALVITGTFKAFDIIWVVTKGGPLDSSQLLSTYYYQRTFTGQNPGYGSTIAVLIIILGLILTFFSNKFTDREKVEM
jgi:raffinose/stachyose/melibiose transport system permease protein